MCVLQLHPSCLSLLISKDNFELTSSLNKYIGMTQKEPGVVALCFLVPWNNVLGFSCLLQQPQACSYVLLKIDWDHTQV